MNSCHIEWECIRTNSQSCWYNLFPVRPPVSLYGILAAIHSHKCSSSSSLNWVLLYIPCSVIVTKQIYLNSYSSPARRPPGFLYTRGVYTTEPFSMHFFTHRYDSMYLSASAWYVFTRCPKISVLGSARMTLADCADACGSPPEC